MQRANPKVYKFYQSRTWKKCRDAYMSSKYYICERCKNAATICHHKIHITSRNIDNPNITLSHDNLEALCLECHNKEHFKNKTDYEFDNEGNLVYINNDQYKRR